MESKGNIGDAVDDKMVGANNTFGIEKQRRQKIMKVERALVFIERHVREKVRTDREIGFLVKYVKDIFMLYASVAAQ